MTRKSLLTALWAVALGITPSLAQKNGWGNIEYKGKPWVENISRPHEVSRGLHNRHISLWASHGRYFDQKKGCWKWQRPNLFCTTEDLFTQTIVVPYLIPMLENAGAVVFTPRERDWQTEELIVDNDTPARTGLYQETQRKERWETTSQSGFAWHSGAYTDGENPFTAGTARMARTTKRPVLASTISYKPQFPKEGRYAVYVSYQSLANSVPDAEYTVHHKGQETKFKVNQQMGAGTWVYLGTFDFDQGCNDYNRVTLSNVSSNKGVVTADAVRFGGGMGNIERGGSVSGYPRCVEGARYSAQWAGAPYCVYSSKSGADDYSDDINVRSFMTNWLGGGSVYMPTLEGKKVPLELSLAVHSDAGYAKDGQGLIGSLAICTTNFHDGKLNAGISRDASKQLAEALLNGVTNDLTAKYGKWNRRYLWDRNYSETRCPEVPSSILETLSHQNFPDMLLGQDPNFRFTLARSIYKTLTRYIAAQHGEACAIQPLAPNNFRIEFVKKNKARLSWKEVADPQEPTARATSYNVYMATGSSGFDNGKNVKGNSFTLKLEPGVLYHFKVTAANHGGESFPTEVLSAMYEPNAQKTILIVNGFHRLSAPAAIDTEQEQGFDLTADPGVSYGATAGWNGAQQCFDKTKMGIEGPGGLGYGGDELAGHFVAGNTFDYVRTHAEAIASNGRYNIASSSSEAVENNLVGLRKYAAVDLILGLEKSNTTGTAYYKTFPPAMRRLLSAYTQKGGRVLASGSYVASDMNTAEEQRFTNDVLKITSNAYRKNAGDAYVTGLGMTFPIYAALNEQHYAATSTDILQPMGTAFCAMQYADGSSAGVAYDGNDYKSFTMGFPFECIKDKNTRHALMRGILNFILK